MFCERSWGEFRIDLVDIKTVIITRGRCIFITI